MLNIKLLEFRSYNVLHIIIILLFIKNIKFKNNLKIINNLFKNCRDTIFLRLSFNFNYRLSILINSVLNSMHTNIVFH